MENHIEIRQTPFEFTTKEDEINIRVLLLGGGLQAMSAAYSLKRHGYSTICIGSVHDECRKFRYIDHFLSIPHSMDSSEYTQELIHTIQSFDARIIIPMSDKAAEYICSHRKVLSEAQCLFATPSLSVFMQGTDKAQFMEFCEKYGFSHPRTKALNDNNLSEAAAYVGFPALIKPNRSVGARGIQLVHSMEELKEKYPGVLQNYGESTLQEYVDVENLPYYNVMLYRNHKGEILGYCIIEILRYYPIKGGSSSLCRTIEKPDLLAECTAVLNKLNWVGMADFDVLINQAGEYKIIEINPRVPASLRAADIAGVNFPLIMCCDLLGEPLPIVHYKTNMYLRYFGLDVIWFLASPKRFSSRPSWFGSFGRKYYFQDVYASDLGTWYRWLTEGFQRYLAKRKHI